MVHYFAQRLYRNGSESAKSIFILYNIQVYTFYRTVPATNLCESERNGDNVTGMKQLS